MNSSAVSRSYFILICLLHMHSCIHYGRGNAAAVPIRTLQDIRLLMNNAPALNELAEITDTAKDSLVFRLDGSPTERTDIDSDESRAFFMWQIPQLVRSGGVHKRQAFGTLWSTASTESPGIDKTRAWEIAGIVILVLAVIGAISVVICVCSPIKRVCCPCC